MFHKRVVLLCLLLLPACWVDFPPSRFGPDSGGNRVPDAGAVSDRGAARDQSQPQADQFVPPADAARMDQGGADAQAADSGADGGLCRPGSFLGCSPSRHALEICDGSGTGSLWIPCTDSICDAAVQRCTACDPQRVEPTCRDGQLEYCTPVGLMEVITCAVDCRDGRCCSDVDGDGDGQTSCDGDCNDDDFRVNEGQEAFFASPNSAGDFDYNCDGTEEPALDEIWVCDRVQAPRWLDRVPACGDTGKQGFGSKQIGADLCVPQLITTVTAECR